MTPNQTKLLNFIESKIKAGGAPTYSEMRDYMEVTSNQTIKDVLNALEDKGYITIEKGKTKGIYLNEKGRTQVLDLDDITSIESTVDVKNSGNATSNKDFVFGSFTLE